MTSIVLVLLLAAQDIAGEWRSVDIQRLETIPNYCARVWIEERAWTLQPKGPGMTGTYEHTVRAMPMGAPSRKAECKWPEAVADPEWTRRRVWSVTAKLQDDESWTVEGRSKADTFGSFRTVVLFRDATLFAENSIAGEPRQFRRPVAVPADALKALEETVNRLHSGSCPEVIRSLGFQAEEAETSCKTREQWAAVTGPFQSLNIIAATRFDRAPISFPSHSALRPRHGVIYDFTAIYEKAETRGNAILYEADGTWRVAMLWL